MSDRWKNHRKAQNISAIIFCFYMTLAALFFKTGVEFKEKFISNYSFYTILSCAYFFTGFAVLCILIKFKLRLETVFSIAFALTWFFTSSFSYIKVNVKPKNLGTVNCNDFELALIHEHFVEFGSSHDDITLYIPSKIFNRRVETRRMRYRSLNLQKLHGRKDLPDFETIDLDPTKKLPSEIKGAQLYWDVMLDPSRFTYSEYKAIANCLLVGDNLIKVNAAILASTMKAKYPPWLGIKSISYIALENLVSRYECSHNELLVVEANGTVGWEWKADQQHHSSLFGEVSDDGTAVFFEKPDIRSATALGKAQLQKRFKEKMEMIPNCKDANGRAFIETYKLISK